MAENQGRDRDFVLAPNEFMFVQDRTKGDLKVHVGPTTGTLQAGSEPVVYDAKTRKFLQTGDVARAVQQFPMALEGSYVVLENPSVDERHIHPELGAANNFSTKLDMGRKVNIRGPETFALWPGQVATVVTGHQLRTNQYLIALVYNDEAARANWDSAVIKPAEPADSRDVVDKILDPKRPLPPKLTMGQLLVIKGTDVSFYIPPTGLEVLPDNNRYVREAVTLERLEYCILLSEDGNKRYVRGPAVVFPEPTETFVTTNEGGRKFRAIELNPDMGLYIKVTADYTEGEVAHKAGDELFITGQVQKLYFPRAEHALIKYGNKEIQYGIAIPAGEARYVLNKRSGDVELVRGPQIFLPDPRTQVIVRRVLSDNEVSLFYPGNETAKQYNAALRTLATARNNVEAPLSDTDVRAVMGGMPDKREHREAMLSYAAFASSDKLDRGTSFTPPRTITLDTKYEGVVAVNVWKGYAVLVVDKGGNQRVEVGPKTVLLKYDETLQVIELSTGKPKSTDKLQRTVYLKCLYNQVSDIVEVVTRDMVTVTVKLSYRVNFEGDDPSKWFAVENYVKFLCDDGRSRLRSAAKQYSIEEFNLDYIRIVRDTILGAKSEGTGRPNRSFEENGLRIYDVELANISIGDAAISELLRTQQHQTVTAALTLALKERDLRDTKRLEAIAREVADQQAETEKHKATLELARINRQLTTVDEKRKLQLMVEKAADEVHDAGLARDKKTKDQELAQARAEQDQDLALLRAEVQAVVDKTEAVTPDLIAALQAFADQRAAGDLAKAVGVMGILGGDSIAEVLNKTFGGTTIARIASSLSASASAAPMESK